MNISKSEKILRKLLRVVNAPFSEYKDTYNKLLASDGMAVDMNENSQEATIVENALIRAGLYGQLRAEDALRLLMDADKITVSHGEILGAYKDSGNIFNFTFNRNIRI